MNRPLISKLLFSLKHIKYLVAKYTQNNTQMFHVGEIVVGAIGTPALHKLYTIIGVITDLYTYFIP